MPTLEGLFTLSRRALSVGPGLALIGLLLEGIRIDRPDISDDKHRINSILSNNLYAEYDFVIVGGGSAGAVMAARLSENPKWNILLLEAGPDEPMISDIPQIFPALQRTLFDWQFLTEPSQEYCLAMENRQCRWPRGKVLGGSSVLNAMLYVRGNRKDYDLWASLGNPGWNYNNILYYFKKSENMRDPKFKNSYYHGTSGPLSVEPFRFTSPMLDIFLEAGRELNMLNPHGDLNGAIQSGIAQSHGTLYKGLRCSTAKAYLRPCKKRKNLHISLNTFVHKIDIDPNTKTVIGVTFDILGAIRKVKAKKEVILSAGALQSPQILMLSGIGPHHKLSPHRIKVIKDIPGIGENLQDHVSACGATYLINNNVTDQTLSFVIPKVLSVKTVEEFVEKYKGPLYAMPASEAMGFYSTKYQDPWEDWPDIQYFFASYGFSSDGGLISSTGSGLTVDNYGAVFEPIVYKDAYMIIPLLMRPRSRGKILLASANPRIHPKIYANYFHDPHDLAVLVEGLKMAHYMSQTKIFRYLNSTLNPYSSRACPHEKFLSDGFWACMARHYSQTIYHPVGTCKMGPREDRMSVVNHRLKVYGINKLRIVDASIMPTICTGGCCGSTKKRTIVGGWAWAWWLVTDVQRLSLEVMTLNPMCENVETAQGVPLTVTGVAQCKIMKMMNVYYFHHQADELLGTASEQFLGKSVREIKQTILQTLEGHLRAILGTLTVEEVYKDRDQFAALVREVAAPDVGRMGIEILSFTIKDVYDDVQYLASLGKAQTASVKRDADAGVAEANRDAGIREAECEKSAMDVKYSTDTKIEDNNRMYKLQKANFDQEINTAKAESQLAYELQAAKIKQKIRNEEIQIEVVERRKQIEIEAQEIQRKELELKGTVRLPAEAESYKVQTIAQGKQTQTMEAARAESEKIKKLGSAEAHAIELVGKSEAGRMKMKASVYKQYGDAAIMNIVLEALPKIAAEVAAPLAKTEEIVLIGGNDATTGDVSRLVGQLPPAINALTGVDLSKVLSKIPGAKA